MTKTSFTIKWEPPENDGGTPVIDYIIEIKQTSKKAWQKVSVISFICIDIETIIYFIINPIIIFFQIANTKGDITNVIISDLKTDTSYNFRITAKNSVGTGPPYIAEEAITAGKRPSELYTTNYFSNISAYSRLSINLQCTELCLINALTFA